MDDKSYLAYVNAKAYCFNHADFNFDARYIFEMELDDTEFLAKYDDVYSEWAPNEKVATEVAYGASVAGSRAFCTMVFGGII